MPTQVISAPVGEIKLGANIEVNGRIIRILDAEHNKHIIALAHWAVDEYNKENKLSLKFVKVVSASKHIVSDGTMYYITLEAATEFFPLPLTNMYDARVWESPCSTSKKLDGFMETIRIG